MKKRYLPIGIAAVMMGATACSTAPAVAPTAGNSVIQMESEKEHTIHLSANETVKVVPDVAELVFAVQTMETDAQTCQTKNNEDVSKVITMLTDNGVDAESIQTSGFGLYPRYDWSDDVQKIVGYEMTTEITVADVPVDQAGTIIGKSVEAGVNQIQSVSYQSSRYDEEYNEALKKAIASAKEKAEAMAEAGGFQLGGIVKIEEQSSSQQARYTNYKMNLEVSAAAGSDAATVMPGEVDVEARVDVEFEILE